MSRIGIFGGSFNPIHNGHLELAREAQSELGLEKIHFVLSPRNPLTSKEMLLPTALRIELLKKVLKDYPSFPVSLVEARKNKPSFTVDTLKYFKKKSWRKKRSVFFMWSGFFGKLISMEITS